MGDPMGRRRYHKKSRQGCTACKRRHVKCDEQGPPCANCRVRAEECDYGVHPEPFLGSQHSSPDPGPSAALSSKRMELELFHQWSVETFRSLVFHQENESLWQVTIPRAALDQDYLLNAILAMSALHLSTALTPVQSSSYQLAALRYHNVAFTAFQSEAPRATAETHLPLFAFSIINLVLAVALPSCLDRDIEKSSILDNLTTVFSLLQGTTSIYRLARTWLFDGPFGNYVRANVNLPTEDVNPRAKAVFNQFRALRDEEYAEMSSSAQSALGAVRTHEITTTAIDSLETCFGITHEDKMVVCFRWMAKLDEEFTQRIRNHEPLALIITMHWAVLLDGLSREKWWAKSSGKALVAEISRILSVSKPEWLPLMSLVHQEVGLPPLTNAGL